MEVFGMKRNIALLVALTSLLVGVYVTKQALASCFSYCVAEDRQFLYYGCGSPIDLCPCVCVREEWQEGSCQFTINPFAGCESVEKVVPHNFYATFCVLVGMIYPRCECDGNNWRYIGRIFVNQPDCNGYTCFGY
jgi:hypothetical protein